MSKKPVLFLRSFINIFGESTVQSQLCGSGQQAVVQQSKCHHMIESISMASHIEGCFLVMISLAEFMYSLHLVQLCIHPHVANIIRSAFQ